MVAKLHLASFTALRLSVRRKKSAEQKFFQLRLADDVADRLDDIGKFQIDVAALQIFF